MIPHPDPRSLGKTVLEARALAREFGTETKTPVLFDVDLSVAAGEFVALTGSSGSGKSTLLYLLGALDRPTRGEVLIDGVEISQLSEAERARLRSQKLGFVFQFHFLLPEFSVLENVMLPMLRRANRQKSDIERHAREVLATVGLAELWQRRPHQLSGGQQQRVAIARAISNDPQVILADEPTGNLDSRNGLVVMELFQSLVDTLGLTIVMVTHERSFAAMASRQILLRDGRLTGAGERQAGAI